jgi:hypothetical protein
LLAPSFKPRDRGGQVVDPQVEVATVRCSGIRPSRGLSMTAAPWGTAAGAQTASRVTDASRTFDANNQNKSTELGVLVGIAWEEHRTKVWLRLGPRLTE